MPKLNYNLDEIADFSSVPAGRYRAKLKKCTQKNAKASGQPMLEWEWEILVGATPKKTKAVKGRQARTWTSLQPQALASLKEHLLAFGLNGKVKNKSTDQLIGKIVVLVFVESISQREGHEGEPDSKVAVVLPKDTPLTKPGELDDDEDDVEEYEDEDDEPKKRKSKKSRVVEEDEEEEDDDFEDDEDDDEDEDEDDEDEEEDDEDEEDEEEEDEPPVKKRTKKSKKRRRV